MFIADVKRVMENERKCVLRAKEINCNQGQCAGCDLVLPSDLILNAYDCVLRILEDAEDDLK